MRMEFYPAKKRKNKKINRTILTVTLTLMPFAMTSFIEGIHGAVAGIFM